MTDEIQALRATRADVDPPTPAARRAARAMWDGELIEVSAPAPGRSVRLATTFTTRAAIAAVVATAIVAGAWWITRNRIESVKPSHVIAVQPLTEAGATDPQVFLVIGSDSRAFVDSPSEAQQFGDPSTIAGQRSDTMMLVRVDPKTRNVLVVSLPRDLWVDVPGHGMAKLNSAFAFGGAPLLVQTITQDFGVAVNHVIEVQFPQFVALIDQLGGLRIRFPVPVRDRYTGLAQPAGCVTLTGNQALAFVRSRHLESLGATWFEDPRADLGRVARQQLALRQLAAAAESRLGTDPRPLLRALFSDITVDSGFTADDALRYFDALRSDHSSITTTIPVQVTPNALLLGPGAQGVFDALNGRGPFPVTAPPTGASGAPTLIPEPTAC